MKIFRFDREAAKSINNLENAKPSLSRILVDQNPETLHVVCAHFDQGNSLGRQQVMTNQLFLVVQGEGWVVKDNNEKVSISAGQAPFWKTGEWHEVGTDTSLVAIILEGPTLNPTNFMPELNLY